MSIRYIIAAGDISSSPVLAKRFRGKVAKEIYRCAKGIVLTGSVTKPVGFAVIQIPGEMTKGFVYSVLVNQVGEHTLGYLSGIGCVRYLYKILQPSGFKETARLVYNVGCLPLTLYSKGVGGAFDLLQISRLEQMWFGQPVYIFDDNRLWIESNFTMANIYSRIDEIQ